VKPEPALFILAGSLVVLGVLVLRDVRIAKQAAREQGQIRRLAHARERADRVLARARDEGSVGYLFWRSEAALQRLPSSEAFAFQRELADIWALPTAQGAPDD
jgi:hypothetical protein